MLSTRSELPPPSLVPASNRPEFKLLIAFLLIAFLILTFGQIVEEVFEGDSSAFDRTLLLVFRNPADLTDPIGPAWIEEMARDVTALGSFTVLTFLVCAISIYLALRGMKWICVWILGTAVGGVALSNGFKALFERPRPDLVTHGVRVFTASFPSGHATLSAVIYLTLGALIAESTRAGAIKIYCMSLAVFLAVAVGVSRVYLGVHYPTDVLAGWSLGAAWAMLSWLLFTRYGEPAS